MPNPEAASVKARRAALKDAPAADGTPPLATTPVMVGEPVARRYATLFDPNEPRAVAEAGGAFYGIEPAQPVVGYVIAEEDAYERITPAGCKTAVTRMRWAAGQHVPTEVYEAYKAALAQAAPTEVEQGTGVPS